MVQQTANPIQTELTVRNRLESGFILLVLGLAWIALYCLLGYRFSPESYRSERIARGATEWVAFVMAGGGILLLVGLSRDPRLFGQAWGRRAWMLFSVSIWILGKAVLGFSLYYYDLLVFLFAIGWSGMGGGQSEESCASRLPDKDARAWIGVLWGMAVGLTVFYLWQQFCYLEDMALGFADLGEVAREMYNSIHNPGTLFLRENPYKPLFYAHFHPGMMPFVCLWRIWSDVRLLIVSQVFVVIISAWPLYVMGKQVFRDRRAAALLGMIWLAYPATSHFIYNASYGFRWGSFCVPMYFAALAAWMTQRLRWALFWACWAVLIKEEAAIAVGMFGLYLSFTERPWWRGGLLAGIAFGYFLVVTSFVLPVTSGAGYAEQSYFAHLGQTKWEILLSPYLQARVFWGKLLEPATFYFAATLLVPLLGWPLKRLSILLTGSLTFLFIALWYNPMFKSICFQYQAALFPVLFWSLISGIKPPCATRQVLTNILITTVLASLFIGNTAWSKENYDRQCFPGRRALLHRVAEKIQPNSTLVASPRSAMLFLNQNQVYQFGQLPPETDYVLLDFRDIISPVGRGDRLSRLRDFQHQIEKQGSFGIVQAEDGALLYAREGDRLDTRSRVETDALPGDLLSAHLSLAPGVNLIGFKTRSCPVDRIGGSSEVWVTTYCSVDAPLSLDVALRCSLHPLNNLSREMPLPATFPPLGQSKFQPLGQCILPVSLWKPGKIYHDEFRIPVPADWLNQPFSVGFDVRLLGSNSKAGSDVGNKNGQ